VNACEQHRSYLAALADGEAELVPAATLTHVADCAGCAAEVETHRLLGARLKASVNADRLAAPRGTARRWQLRLGAAATVVVAMAAAAAGWHAYTGEDKVAAAVAVAADQPQYMSADASSIMSWCERASGRPMREVALPDLSPVGARMDHRAGTDIVTVTYATAQGERISVSWLDASQAPTGKTEVQTRTIDGRTALVVTSPSGIAVITGRAPLSSLWATAAGLEAGAGSTPTRAPAT
jgi:hypothetical protein